LNLYDIRDTVKYVIKYFLIDVDYQAMNENEVLEFSKRFFKLTRDDVLTIYGKLDSELDQ